MLDLAAACRKAGLFNTSVSDGGSIYSAANTDGATGHVRKPNAALKPSKLTRDATPVEFAVWLEAYMAYYSSSRMELAPLPEQMAYLKACLDTGLLSRLDSELTSQTPILYTSEEKDGSFDPALHNKSAFQALEEEFLLQYPIFTRRLDFFRHAHPPNQTFSEWIQEVDKMGDQCSMTEGLSADEVYVLRYRSALQNQKLREELLKLDNPTRHSIREAVQKWEVAQRCSKGITAPPHKSASSALQAQTSSVAPSRGGGARQKQPQHPQATTQGANNQRGGFRCMRCGSTNSQHNCTAIGATCKKCGKKGHYKGVCLTPVRDGQTGKGNSKAKVATTSQATTTAKANVASSSS